MTLLLEVRINGEVAVTMQETRIHSAEAAFERLLPRHLRKAARFWTAGVVAELGARWLELEGARSVLDVGSGIGKFCTLGALSTRLHFCGVEHRADLVSVARSTARSIAAENVSFVHARFTEVDARAYDALYFYNPFQENFCARWYQLDQKVELHPRRFERDVAAAERILKDMPVGSWLLTYYQFGGRIPLGYSLLRAAHHQGSVLRLWRKDSAGIGHGYWVEQGERLLRRGHQVVSTKPPSTEVVDC